MENTRILLAAAEGADPGGGLAALAGAGIAMVLVYLAVILAVVAGVWKIFTKAGKPGWAALIPIYNLVVLLEITGQPLWYIVLYLIPCTAPIAAVIVALELSKRFGQGVGFGLGLAFLAPVFLPLLGFGSYQYFRPVAA